MASELERQAAEMPCPNCAGYGYFQPSPAGGPAARPKDCYDCKGTKLRWPTLSRECGGPETGRWNDDCIYTVGTHSFGKDELEGFPCPCNGSGRVPDVDLEKVLTLGWHWEIGKNDYADPNTTWICLLRLDESDFEFFTTGDTSLDAASAALLATVEA